MDRKKLSPSVEKVLRAVLWVIFVPFFAGSRAKHSVHKFAVYTLTNKWTIRGGSFA